MEPSGSSNHKNEETESDSGGNGGQRVSFASLWKPNFRRASTFNVHLNIMFTLCATSVDWNGMGIALIILCHLMGGIFIFAYLMQFNTVTMEMECFKELVLREF